MRQISFTVHLTFQDSIETTQEEREVANNILSAVVNQANGQGIAPEESETFLTEIEVSNQGVSVARYNLLNPNS